MTVQLVQITVALTPQAGETIDGGATYEIKSYNGCSIWSDGTEWIVIQAKQHNMADKSKNEMQCGSFSDRAGKRKW